MPSTTVRLNGQKLDYEDSEKNVTISKACDDFEKIGTSTGSMVTNSINRLVIPATANNSRIIKQAYAPTNNSKLQRRVASLTVEIGGSYSFNGRAVLVQSTVNDYSPSSFVLETLGDSMDLWEAMDGVSLRQIPMGTVIWNTQNVLDSQGLGVASTPVCWAPVCYGNTSGSTDPLPTTNGAMFRTKDFRPHVYFKHIVTSIFNFFGYTVDSNFFDTLFFEEWVYCFGVGKLWQTVVAADDVVFYSETTYPQTYTSPTGEVLYQIDFDGVVEDPQSGWSPSPDSWWEIPETGTYKIETFVQAGNATEVHLIIDNPLDPGPTLDGVLGSWLVVGSPNSTVEFTAAFKAGGRVMVKYKPIASVSSTVVVGSYLRITRLTEVTTGTELRVESFLHDKECKEFLRGISHMFNLLWFVNHRLRVVYCEPRFDYFIPNIYSGVIERLPGWYRSPSTAEPLPMKLSSDTVQFPIYDAFGKFIRMAYNQHDDPGREYYKKFFEVSQLQMYGVQVDFVDRGKNGTDSENPYFGDLFMGYSNTVSTQGHALPWILPGSTSIDDVFAVDSNGVIVGTFPAETTFESEPKCGILYRSGTFVRHEDAILDGIAISDYALIMQKNILAHNTSSRPITNKWNGSFCKTRRYTRNSEAQPNVLTNEYLTGLVDYFYRQYFACINEQLKMIAEFSLKNSQVSAENFRTLKKLYVDGKYSLWILNNIRDFNPSNAESTTCELYKFVRPTKEFVDSFIHNDPQQPPLNHININALE